MGPPGRESGWTERHRGHSRVVLLASGFRAARFQVSPSARTPALLLSPRGPTAQGVPPHTAPRPHTPAVSRPPWLRSSSLGAQVLPLRPSLPQQGRLSRTLTSALVIALVFIDLCFEPLLLFMPLGLAFTLNTRLRMCVYRHTGVAGRSLPVDGGDANPNSCSTSSVSPAGPTASAPESQPDAISRQLASAVWTRELGAF